MFVLGGGQPLNKAFTLIELLSVIVILAVIALIATPIILGIIKDTKKEADKRSVEMYYKALENAIAQQQLDGSKLITGTFSTENGKDILLNGQTILTVDYDGPEITVKRIDIYEDGSVYLEEIKEKANDKLLTKKYGIKQRYIDGEEVYIDVTTGKSCTNYHVDNSKTGYNGLEATKSTENQNSCLKFYAFLDGGSKNLNLLLDHNTTAKLAWNSSGSNVSGPKEVLEQLKTDTNEWVVGKTSLKYINEAKGYTLNYSEYKARLITANEVAKITGADKVLNWDETLTESNWYYLDGARTNDTVSNWQTQVANLTNKSDYYWLFDRTYNCTNKGCLNNSIGITYGYWTSSALASRSDFAWHVSSSGSLRNSTVLETRNYGVRPVIEVSKSNL